MAETIRWYGTGRRKEATARVWVTVGDGKVVINKRPMDVYFGRKVLQMVMQQPIELTEQLLDTIKDTRAFPTLEFGQRVCSFSA